jgi:single-strand selective monofunctional uracil DNA glycosylase
MDLFHITDDLIEQLSSFTVSPPVTHVYNPLVYARRPYDLYLQKFGSSPKEVLLLGMNPGPWGMVQTGIPFGTIHHVRDWLNIEGPVQQPVFPHPKRPVSGFSCHRKEISGDRICGWLRKTFKHPTDFFDRFFIANYCPLAFFEHNGRNRTPDRLSAADKKRLFSGCDLALQRTVTYFNPSFVVGIGRFAEKRINHSLAEFNLKTGFIPHPSPANPAANRQWEKLAQENLKNLGIAMP